MKRLIILLCVWLIHIGLSGQQIVGAEYFTDIDPGYGKGSSIPVTAGSLIELDLQIPLEGLNAGLHTLYLRVKDNNDRWSQTLQRIFMLLPLPQEEKFHVSYLEYFFDEDPGFGKGNQIPIQPGVDVTAAVEIPLEILSEGMHTLYMRARDSNGSWGMIFSRTFLKFLVKEEETLVERLEYFINTDPGFGKGTPVELNNPKEKVMKYFVIDAENLQPGKNRLYLRALDNRGRWSLVYNTEFDVLQSLPCDPPAGLAASGVTETTADLFWNVEETASAADLLWVPAALDYSEEGSFRGGLQNPPYSADGLLQSTLYAYYARYGCQDGQVSAWAGPLMFHTIPLSVNQITLLADPPEGGILTGAGSYAYGQNISITATPNTDYRFLYWSGDTIFLNDSEADSAILTMPAQSVTLTAHFRDATGIYSNPEYNLKIYPNPTGSQFWIELYNMDNQWISIQLLNIQGHIISEQLIRGVGDVKTSFSTYRLTPGLYMLLIKSEHWNAIRKVVVKD